MASSSVGKDENSEDVDAEETYPLTGKPYFDIILPRSSIKPAYQLVLILFILFQLMQLECVEGNPCRSHRVHSHFVKGLPVKAYEHLPSTDSPAVLMYRGKKWQMKCIVSPRGQKRLDAGWRAFVKDNNLNDGDACVFEIMESSDKLVKFKVQILRGDIPSSLLERTTGETEDSPITVD